jgi:aminoglycoside-2''-adenylyltransferase
MTLAYGPAAGQWQRLHPREARSLLGHIRLPWWIAGGWALDLYIGQQGRPHKDLDIGILRRDAPSVLAALDGWEFFEARGGELFGPLTGAPREDVNSLWGRRVRTSEWVLELLLDDAEGDEWVYRRDRRLRRPLDAVIRYDAQRTPYLAPEIQLLYKSSHIRAEDELDFERVSALLDDASRRWLCLALSQLDGQHRWLPALRAAGRTVCDPG